MFKRTPIAATFIAATTLLMIASGCSATNTGKTAAAAPAAKSAKVDYTTMTPAALAEHLIFEVEGYDLKQPTQEGTTGRDRLTQDEIQKACSTMKNAPVDDATAEKVRALAAASIKYPPVASSWVTGRKAAS